MTLALKIAHLYMMILNHLQYNKKDLTLSLNKKIKINKFPSLFILEKKIKIDPINK